MSKIIDLIKAKEEGSKPFISIEFFPPRTADGVKVRDNDLNVSLFRRVFMYIDSLIQFVNWRKNVIPIFLKLKY